MNKKLNQFINRNRKRNAHLYSDRACEGYDYIVCPISGERLSMIKDNYIVAVLGMKPEDYPDVPRICNRRKENIKTGLQKVDAATGLTKYEISQQKAQATLSAVDENNVSGYKKKGQATRAAHLCNVDHLGRNGYAQQVYNRLTTILPNGLTVEENAHIKQRDTLVKNKKTCNTGASKQSKLALKQILEFLNEQLIEYYFDKNEYCIKDVKSGNYYFYDLTIPKFQMAIEYQSAAWHANPVLSNDEWAAWTPPRGKKKTPEEVLAYDYMKAKALFENRNFATYYVWQHSQQTDIEDILCLLKTMNTKS